LIAAQGNADALADCQSLTGVKSEIIAEKVAELKQQCIQTFKDANLDTLKSENFAPECSGFSADLDRIIQDKTSKRCLSLASKLKGDAGLQSPVEPDCEDQFAAEKATIQAAKGKCETLIKDAILSFDGKTLTDAEGKNDALDKCKVFDAYAKAVKEKNTWSHYALTQHPRATGLGAVGLGLTAGVLGEAMVNGENSEVRKAANAGMASASQWYNKMMGKPEAAPVATDDKATVTPVVITPTPSTLVDSNGQPRETAAPGSAPAAPQPAKTSASQIVGYAVLTAVAVAAIAAAILYFRSRQ
jgi:hypothetical protein